MSTLTKWVDIQQNKKLWCMCDEPAQFHITQHAHKWPQDHESSKWGQHFYEHMIRRHWRTPQRNLKPKIRLQNFISLEHSKTWFWYLHWEYCGSSKKSSKFLNWTGENKVTKFPTRKTLVHLKCPNHEGDEDSTSELYTQPADNEDQHQMIRNQK